MSRKPVKLNTLPGERLKRLISENGYTQKEFAEKMGYTAQHLSLIVTGKRNLTDEAAQRVIEIFPHVRIEWLKGYDDDRTQEDQSRKRANLQGNYVLQKIDGNEIIDEIKETLEAGQVHPDGLLRVLDYAKVIVNSGLFHISPASPVGGKDDSINRIASGLYKYVRTNEGIEVAPYQLPLYGPSGSSPAKPGKEGGG